MNFDFTGRTVLVTGAAHGFGRVIAGAFGVRGATVHVCDVVESELVETVDIVGARCFGRVVDVTDRAAVGIWVEGAVRQSGGVDVLVNNAGGVLGQTGRPIDQVPPEDWQAIVAVNQTAAFYTSQAVAYHMKAAKHGSIVNISSGAGLGVSLTGIQAYASAKAGLIGLTRQLAHELGPHGIRVNAIAPGFALTNDASRAQWESYGRDGQEALLERISLRRLGTPADIAHAVVFLASEYASWITGVTLPVDGGRL